MGQQPTIQSRVSSRGLPAPSSELSVPHSVRNPYARCTLHGPAAVPGRSSLLAALCPAHADGGQLLDRFRRQDVPAGAFLVGPAASCVDGLADRRCSLTEDFRHGSFFGGWCGSRSGFPQGSDAGAARTLICNQAHLLHALVELESFYTSTCRTAPCTAQHPCGQPRTDHRARPTRPAGHTST